MIDLSTIDVSRFPHWLSPGWEVLLIQADCLDVLPVLPDGCVDAVIADPPYGIGFTYDGHKDNDRDYEGGYKAWLRSRIAAVQPALSTGAPSFYWQSQKRLIDFTEMFPAGFRVLVNGKTMGQIFPTPMQFRWDPIVSFWNGRGRSFANGAFDFFVSNNSAEYGDANSIEREHPCPRPIYSVLHILTKWTLPGWAVLDPFAGSGTTGVACIRTGRQFIGIEIEEKYFRIAVKRCEDALGKGSLFDEERIRQESLFSSEP